MCIDITHDMNAAARQPLHTVFSQGHNYVLWIIEARRNASICGQLRKSGEWTQPWFSSILPGTHPLSDRDARQKTNVCFALD